MNAVGRTSPAPAQMLPSFRDDLSTVAWWLTVGLVVGSVIGGVVGGLGGRIVMFVLRLTSDANGLTSDDGFQIGEFSVSDSLQLYSGMALGGAINGVLYVVVRRLLPQRYRVVLWGLTGAAVVGALVIHTGGVDFNFLEPVWFAIAAFVALPGLAALAVASAVERLARVRAWGTRRRALLLVVPALPGLLAAPVAAVAGAVGLVFARIPAARRLLDSRLAHVVALVVVAALVVVGALDIARNTARLL